MNLINKDELQVIICANYNFVYDILMKIRINEVLNPDIKIIAICTDDEWLHDNNFYSSLRGDIVKTIPFISIEQLKEITNNHSNYIVIVDDEINDTNHIIDKLKNVGITKTILYSIVNKFTANSLTQIHSFNKNNEALFLCAPMKTGNITIESTLPIHDIKYLTFIHRPNMFNFFNNYDKIKIITAVREPIIRDLSVIYQELSAPYENVFYTNMKKIFKNKEAFLSNENNISIFHDLFVNQSEKFPQIYYMEKFFTVFNENIIDLFSYPFDKEKGYSIIKKDNIEVFVYQLEKMNDIVKDMSNWIGQTDFDEWVIANNSNVKWIANSYKQAQKNIKFSYEYFNNSYNQKWVTHFYSQNDIEKFKDKWCNNIK